MQCRSSSDTHCAVNADNALSESAVVRLLASLVSTTTADTRRTLLEPLSPSEIGAVHAVARAHGVEPWLACSVPSPDGAWAAVAEQRLGFAAAHVRELAALREIDAILADLDCPWLVVKGRALAEDLYPRPDMRHNVDMDVLVPPTRFGDVLNALQDHRWRLLDRNWPLAAAMVPGELRLRSPRGDLLDLHWHLLASPAMRAQFRLPTSHLLGRRRWLASGLPVLHEVDQLVHLGAHGALSGADRLVWLLDAGLAARRISDWDAVASATRDASLGCLLALVLARGRHVLGTPAPPKALSRMGASPAWRLACRVVDRVSPLGSQPDRPALARSFARSARRSTTASLLEIASHGLAWLRSGARRTRPASPLADPHDERSPLYVADDAAAMNLYLAVVEESA